MGEKNKQKGPPPKPTGPPNKLVKHQADKPIGNKNIKKDNL